MCQKYFQWLSILLLSSFSLSLKAANFSTQQIDLIRVVERNGHINTSEEHDLVRNYLINKSQGKFPATASELHQLALKLPASHLDKKLFLILSHSFKTPLLKQELIRAHQGGSVATLSPEKEQSHFKTIWTAYRNPGRKAGRSILLPASNGNEKQDFFLKLYSEGSEEKNIIKEAELLNASLPLEEPPPEILNIETARSRRVFPAILRPSHLGSLAFTLEKMSFWTKERRALMVLHEGLKILARYEAMGLVHQNITPSNLVFTNDGQLVLRNFEGAFLLDENAEQTFPLSGTLHYHAPEQLFELLPEASEIVPTPKRDLPKRDVFSLGLVIAEMLLENRFFSSNGLRHVHLLGDQYAHFPDIYETVQESLKGKTRPDKKDYVKALRAVHTNYYDGSQDVQEQLLFLARFRGTVIFPILWKMLHPDPVKRISASEALRELKSSFIRSESLKEMKEKVYWKAWERLHEKPLYRSSSLAEQFEALTYLANSGLKDLRGEGTYHWSTRMWRPLWELGF